MKFITRKVGATRRPRATRAFNLETLESRVVLSGASHVHATAVLGTIAGHISNDATGNGVRHVEVGLINSRGRVEQLAFTNAAGDYQFRIRRNGPYVVHAFIPRAFTQTSPTFPNVAPTGSFSPGFGNSSWTYSGSNTDPTAGPVDPFAWDTIAPAGNLPFQSPINITSRPTDLSKVLTVNYSPSVPTQIVNNGHQFQVQFSGASTADTITVAGVTSKLAQFHYHAPSETLVKGKSFAAEEHFVNLSAAGGETVLAVFLKIGAHNDALDPILSAALANLSKSGSKTPGTVPINFAGLLPTSMQGWSYEGSLTTPPLSQPVNWFVFSSPITLDAQQAAEYHQLATTAGFDPNARPVQPLDGRRLNETDYDVNFQGQSVVDMNFTLAHR